MKAIHNISLCAVMMLLVSCTQWSDSENNRMMQQARLLVELSPDNALMLLDSINTVLFSEKEKAEHILLRVQARDNAGLNLSTDIEIFQARDYFMKKKDWEKAALACFYSGRVVDEKDNIALETGYYRKGLELAIKTDNELLQGKILYHMGYLNFDRQWYTDAITQYQQALRIFQSINGQQKQEVFSLIAIGNSFVAEQKPDSAHYYFTAALEKALIFDDAGIQAMVYNNMMNAFSELNMLDTAIYFGRQSLNLLSTDIEKAGIYEDIAQVFLKQGEYDSSRYYIVKAYPIVANKNDIYELANFYHIFYQIEKEAGNYASSLEYFELYAKYRTELTDWNDIHKLLEFQKKYEIAEKEKNYNQGKSIMWRFIGIISMIAFSLSIVVVRYQRKNLSQKIRITQTEHEREEAFQKLETLQNIIHKRNNEKQIAFLEELKIIKEVTMIGTKLSAPITVIGAVNTLISKFSIQKFLDITNELYPNFTVKLRDLFPNANLTEKETCVCCLILCGFSNKELALLIYKKVEPQTVQKIKNRIRKKLSIPSYSDIQKFIIDEIVNK
jgi:tetratricopeptide (TPR) repeat protein